MGKLPGYRPRVVKGTRLGAGPGALRGRSLDITRPRGLGSSPRPVAGFEMHAGQIREETMSGLFDGNRFGSGRGIPRIQESVRPRRGIGAALRSMAISPGSRRGIGRTSTGPRAIAEPMERHGQEKPVVRVASGAEPHRLLERLDGDLRVAGAVLGHAQGIPVVPEVRSQSDGFPGHLDRQDRVVAAPCQRERPACQARLLRRTASLGIALRRLEDVIP